MPEWFQPAWDAIGAALAFCGALARWVFVQLRKLEDGLSSHKLYAAETFATKKELAATEADIKSGLARIEGKLDTLLLQRAAKGAGE
jgi:hypothetical protein